MVHDGRDIGRHCVICTQRCPCKVYSKKVSSCSCIQDHGAEGGFTVNRHTQKCHLVEVDSLRCGARSDPEEGTALRIVFDHEAFGNSGGVPHSVDAVRLRCTDRVQPLAAAWPPPAAASAARPPPPLHARRRHSRVAVAAAAAWPLAAGLAVTCPPARQPAAAAAASRLAALASRRPLRDDA